MQLGGALDRRKYTSPNINSLRKRKDLRLFGLPQTNQIQATAPHAGCDYNNMSDRTSFGSNRRDPKAKDSITLLVILVKQPTFSVCILFAQRKAVANVQFDL